MKSRKTTIEKISENLFKLGRMIIVKNLKESFHKFNITPSQGRVLHIVEHKKDVNIKEIASCMSISSSAATQLVDELVNHGFLTREPSTEDRRFLHIKLTEESRDQLKKFKEAKSKEMSQIFEVLTDTELETFLNITEKISSYINTNNKTKGNCDGCAEHKK